MAMLVNYILSNYKRIVYDLADERAQDYPLLWTPWPSITIVVLYLYFVFKLGPTLMSNRKPMNVNRFIQFYDIVQIVVCSCFTYKCLTIIHDNPGVNIFCEPVDYTRSELSMTVLDLGYVYFLLKILDLMDTVFIVLRKKNNQLTFLHLFHHSIMIIASWITLRYFAGGTNALVPFINTFVHAVMYMYYFVTNAWPETRKSIWLKKKVTQLQILQFFVFGVSYSLVLINDCQISRENAWHGLACSFSICALFLNFYWKTYIKSTNQQKVKNQ